MSSSKKEGNAPVVLLYMNFPWYFQLENIPEFSIYKEKEIDG